MTKIPVLLASAVLTMALSGCSSYFFLTPPPPGPIHPNSVSVNLRLPLPFGAGMQLPISDRSDLFFDMSALPDNNLLQCYSTGLRYWLTPVAREKGAGKVSVHGGFFTGRYPDSTWFTGAHAGISPGIYLRHFAAVLSIQMGRDIFTLDRQALTFASGDFTLLGYGRHGGGGLFLGFIGGQGKGVSHGNYDYYEYTDLTEPLPVRLGLYGYADF